MCIVFAHKQAAVGGYGSRRSPTFEQCAGPSPLVVMRLCCAGREFGKQLLQRLKHARRSFEEGVSPAFLFP